MLVGHQGFGTHECFYLEGSFTSSPSSFTVFLSILRYTLKKTPIFYSEIILDYVKIAKNSTTNSHIPFTKASQMLAFYHIYFCTGVLDTRAMPSCPTQCPLQQKKKFFCSAYYVNMFLITHLLWHLCMILA